tara:strand:+ start:1630 stop:2583 length:954 start_codon:yes stop_codon:yes gene_type:complete
MVTSDFHNALILSIVEITSGKDPLCKGIFSFIQLMINETNNIISTGGRSLGSSSPADPIRRYLNGAYSYPLENNNVGYASRKERIPYRDCLIMIHKYLEEGRGGWGDIVWFDVITYLIFIQSNCHHKGNTDSTKLCRNSDSFLHFFYKSKNEFDPWGRWLSKIDTEGKHLYIPLTAFKLEKTKSVKYLADWWVNAFKREKERLLMYDTLQPDHYLGHRFTTGWTVRTFSNIRKGDIIPYASVLNQLRDHYNLPPLSGDYGIGVEAEKLRRFEENTIKRDTSNSKEEIFPCYHFLERFEWITIGFGLGLCLTKILNNK